MIFVTVGAQEPFDRLIRAVDGWAEVRERSDIYAQVGDSHYRAKHIETTPYLNPRQFRKTIEASNFVVSHAGMGSVITALELGKPIIVMPRRGDLKETRNDHQIATSKKLFEQGRVIAAFDEQQLFEKLDTAAASFLQATDRIALEASPTLIAAIRDFIEDDSKALRKRVA